MGDCYLYVNVKYQATGIRMRVGSPDYKWVALSNTTLGMLIATINGSILLIALPDIFRGCVSWVSVGRPRSTGGAT